MSFLPLRRARPSIDFGRPNREVSILLLWDLLSWNVLYWSWTMAKQAISTFPLWCMPKFKEKFMLWMNKCMDQPSFLFFFRWALELSSRKSSCTHPTFYPATYAIMTKNASHLTHEKELASTTKRNPAQPAYPIQAQDSDIPPPFLILHSHVSSHAVNIFTRTSSRPSERPKKKREKRPKEQPSPCPAKRKRN